MLNEYELKNKLKSLTYITLFLPPLLHLYYWVTIPLIKLVLLEEWLPNSKDVIKAVKKVLYK